MPSAQFPGPDLAPDYPFTVPTATLDLFMILAVAVYGGEFMLGKVTLLTLGFAGAFAIGMGTQHWLDNRSEAPAAEVTIAASDPAAPVAAERATEPTMTRRAPSPTALLSSVPASQPDLQQRLKPLLNRGTNMSSAAEGFTDGHQFATVAHVSHNTQVPFVVIKHRVLNEGRTLESVIREFKPELDAKAEAVRAREEAAQDFAWPK